MHKYFNKKYFNKSYFSKSYFSKSYFNKRYIHNIATNVNKHINSISNYIIKINNDLRYSALNAYSEPRFNEHTRSKNKKVSNPNYYKNESLEDKIITDALTFANTYEEKTPFTKSFLFMLHLSYLDINPEIIHSVMLRKEGLCAFSHSSQKLKLEEIKKYGFKSTKELYERIKNIPEVTKAKKHTKK